MLEKLKRAVKKYDDWCEELGLTQEQGRCCTPIRKEDYSGSCEKEKSELKSENINSEKHDSGAV